MNRAPFQLKCLACVMTFNALCTTTTLRVGYIGGYTQPTAAGGVGDGDGEEMSEGEREAAAAAAKAKSDALTVNGLAFAAGLASTLALLAGEKRGRGEGGLVHCFFDVFTHLNCYHGWIRRALMPVKILIFKKVNTLFNEAPWLLGISAAAVGKAYGQSLGEAGALRR